MNSKQPKKIKFSSWVPLFSFFSLAIIFTISWQVISYAASMVWNGPLTKVIYDSKGAGLLINGQRVKPVFIAVPTWKASQDASKWPIVEYEIKKATSHGVSIVAIGLDSPYNNNDSYHDRIITSLKNAGSPYIVLSLAMYRNGGQPPVSDRMTLQTRNGNIGTYDWYETLSQDWINGAKERIRATLEYYNTKYPNKVVGITFHYLGSEWFTWPRCYNVTDGFWDGDWPDTTNHPNDVYVRGWPDYNSKVQTAFGATLPTVLQRSTPSYGNYFHTASNSTSASSIRFNRFHSDRICDALVQMSQYSKSITDNKILVRVYYGYINELQSLGACPAVGSGHLSLKTLLECPYIDMLTSPHSSISHDAGATFAGHGPMDSTNIYKIADPANPSNYLYKMWFHEDDTRTYLANLTGSNDATGRYCSVSLENNIEIARRNVLTAGIHRTGMHFIDLYGEGWFGNPSYETESESLWNAIQNAMNQVDGIKFKGTPDYVPEIAVFCDDSSAALEMLDPHAAATGVDAEKYNDMRSKTIYEAFRRITKINSPIRYCLVSDLLRDEFPASRIKFAVFLNTFKITNAVRSKIDSKLKKDGKTLLFIYAAGLAKDDDVLDPANIASLTGISTLRGSGGYNLANSVTYNGATYSYGTMQFNVDPWFYVDANASGVSVLGTYTGKTSPNNRSVVSKDFGTHKVIYSASLDLPVELYRSFAKSAGVKVFSSNTNDVVDGAGNTLMIYGSDPGLRTITFPFSVNTVTLERSDGSQQIAVNGTTTNVYIVKKGETLLLRWPVTEPVNNIPVLTLIGDKTVNENSQLSFTLSATDADQDALTYTASGIPTGGTFSHSTKTFTWTPSNAQSGTYNVTFTVSDGNGGTDSETIKITVNDVNTRPVLNSIGNKSVNENSTLTFTVNGSDADGDTLTYSATNLPTGAVFNQATRIFSWSPTYDQANAYTVTFSVNDGKGGTASETITITVANVNRNPVLSSIGNKSVNENSNLTFTVNASDVDGDTLTYTATNVPTGAVFNSSTKTFSWTPGYDQAKSYSVYFSVNDGKGGGATEAITITVNNSNRPPVLAVIGNKTVSEGTQLTFTLSAVDADGETLAFNLDNKPSGASFSSVTGTFSWTPSSSQNGTYPVTFSVKDTHNETDSEAIIITVQNVNHDPVFDTIGTQYVDENVTLTFTVSASDADGDILTYGTSTLPQGASFNASTRTFSWKPTYSQAGQYSVFFTANDGNGGTASKMVRIIVLDVVETEPLKINSIRTTDETGIVTMSKVELCLDHSGGTGTGIQVSLSNDNITWSSWAGYTGSVNVSLTEDSGPKTVYVKLKDSANNEASSSTTVTLITPMTVGVFDNDIKKDIALVGETGRSIYMYLNGSIMNALKNIEPAGLNKCNIDGIGRDEIVMSFNKALLSDNNLFSGLYVCDTGTGNMLMTQPTSPKSYVCADITGDGKDEIIADYGKEYGIWVYDPTKPAASIWTLLHPVTSKSMTVGDIDGNGRKDIVIDFGNKGGMWCLDNYPSSDPGSRWRCMHNASAEHIVCADINGDGRDEVITDFGTKNGIWIYDTSAPSWAGMPSWCTWRTVRLHGLNSYGMAAGNFDGDAGGRDDVAIDFGPLYGIWIYMNDSGTWEKATGLSGYNMIAGDMDMNGMDELIVDFGQDTGGVKKGVKVMYNNDLEIFRNII